MCESTTQKALDSPCCCVRGARVPAGEVLVGRAAQAHALKDPANTFSSVKRFIVRLRPRARFRSRPKRTTA
jgi:hypothetical protein